MRMIISWIINLGRLPNRLYHELKNDYLPITAERKSMFISKRDR